MSFFMLAHAVDQHEVKAAGVEAHALADASTRCGIRGVAPVQFDQPRRAVQARPTARMVVKLR